MSFSRTCLRSSRLPPVRLVKNGSRIIAWPCGAKHTYEITLVVAYRSYGINKITASKDFANKTLVDSIKHFRIPSRLHLKNPERVS